MMFHIRLLKSVLKFYTRLYPLISSLRGATYLKSSLEFIILKKVLITNEEHYQWNYKGTKIVSDNIRDFTEIVAHKNVIKGYLYNYSLSEGDVVIDAGAYPGIFTVYAAKNCRKVIALEPDSDNMQNLKDILRLNQVENVEFIEKGLWDSSTSLNFDQKSSVTSKIDEDGEEIETTTLDEVCRSLNARIDFVKMDIEGAEIRAIKGADKVLREEKPYLAIASYHEYQEGKTADFLPDLIEQRGYEVANVFPQHLTTVAWPKTKKGDKNGE